MQRKDFMQQKRKLPIPENQIDPIYNNWNEVKKKLAKNTKLPFFKEGQVFWCSVGQNIGTEIYGKGPNYTRPVLIYKKLSKLDFLGVPFSTKIHKGRTWYVPLNFAGKNQAAVLSRIRVYDAARLQDCMGELTKNDFAKVQDGFETLYFREKIFPQP